MKLPSTAIKVVWCSVTFCCALTITNHAADAQPNRQPGAPPPGASPPDGGPGFDGPPPFGFDDFGPGGPGGFGPGGRGGRGGPGGMGGVAQERQIVKQFDKNGDGWLNNEERKAAREFLSKQGNSGGFGGRRGGFGPRGGNQATPQPGRHLSPADVKSFPNAPLYAPDVLRTFFLEFENTDWEKELADFKGSDVEVPAKVTVDGKTYANVGVHFHGMSSYMMVGEGQKRSIVLSFDYVKPNQKIGGYRKLNLLNSHEDPSFLRTVLSMQVARDYLPAPKANFVRVVINGECWGVYVNQEHFSKEFAQEWFASTKGARWKVPGSPNGRGGLAYLGDDPAAYKRIYDLKSKDDPKSWASLITLCKVLNNTPPDKLEKALEPILDIDAALKFLAWDIVMAGGDGVWTRISDYDLCQDDKGRFHFIPYDANEAYSTGGGPGGPGGRGGRGGRGGPGGFGSGMMIAPQMLAQADKNGDQKVTKEELLGLADTWFDQLDTEKDGKLNQDQFISRLNNILPPPQGFGPPGGDAPGNAQQPGGGRGGFGPATMIGQGLFTALDDNKDGSLTRVEVKDAFAKWFSQWDAEKTGALGEDQLLKGLNAALPQPSFGGPGGRGGGPGGGRGRGPGGGGPGGRGGVQLDPLVAADDANKPMISKLLSVPALKTRYLGYVREMTEKWLEWNKLGPLAKQYQALIAEDVKADTRKLDSFEGFQSAIEGVSGGDGGMKGFVEKRRAYLLNLPAVKAASK